MASGQQIAEKNFQLFDAWSASKLDQDFRQMVSRGVLSRKEIAKECGFAKSALDQNPRIKALLKQIEDGLRLRGILPPQEIESFLKVSYRRFVTPASSTRYVTMSD